jgi:hypothetical protein
LPTLTENRRLPWRNAVMAECATLFRPTLSTNAFPRSRSACRNFARGGEPSLPASPKQRGESRRKDLTNQGTIDCPKRTIHRMMPDEEAATEECQPDRCKDPVRKLAPVLALNCTELLRTEQTPRPKNIDFMRPYRRRRCRTRGPHLEAGVSPDRLSFRKSCYYSRPAGMSRHRLPEDRARVDAGLKALPVDSSPPLVCGEPAATYERVSEEHRPDRGRGGHQPAPARIRLIPGIG